MPTAAAGTRITWLDLPEHLRAWVVDLIGGGPMVSAQSQAGGFSPGTADRVLTVGGRRGFVKAVSRAQNDRTPDMHCREAAVVSRLPASRCIPRLLGSHDDDDWVVLVFEDVQGRTPHLPWLSPEVEIVVQTLSDLAHDLTPSPLPELGDLPDALAVDFGGWRRIRADPPVQLDHWTRANLDDLVTLADRGLSALAGNTIVHLDVRADNLLITGAGQVVVVDWPWARNGAAWIDRLLLIINVDLHGGHDPNLLLDENLGSLTQRADITAVLAGFSGFFADAARQPPVPGVPTVRAFQADQAASTLRWLRQRMES